MCKLKSKMIKQVHLTKVFLDTNPSHFWDLIQDFPTNILLLEQYHSLDKIDSMWDST